MVNRVWLHLFGRGLVATPDNFGAAGQPPSHPELLDSLAVTFMDQGWSVKELIRQIVLSRAYQLASSHDARNFEADPDNTLVWRMSKKRLEAEAIRDAVLCASGRLIVEPPVGSAVAQAGEGLAGPNRRFNQDGSGPAPGGLPAGGARPGAGLARALRLRRPEPGDRRACLDQRPVAGALPDEQPVHHPPGRGRRRSFASSRRQRRGPGQSRLSAVPLPGTRPRPRRPERATSSRDSPRPKTAATASAPPGRPSARPCTPVPSSVTSTERSSTQHSRHEDSFLMTHTVFLCLTPGGPEGPLVGVRLRRVRRALVVRLGRRIAGQASPLAPKAPHFPARAKRVIFLCMHGAPSHVDTFDFKPRLAADSGKPSPIGRLAGAKLLGSPWTFSQHGQSGQWISELFPEVAVARRRALRDPQHAHRPARPSAGLL